MSVLLTAADLSVGYENTPVVEGLNFTLERGDYLCIVGENGSGKTTLMRTLLRLIPPISGKLEFQDALQNGAIGYLPQQTVVQQDFPASVREIVMSGFQGKKIFHPFYTAAEKKQAEENMKRMGITSLANKCYRELSGGQQQRVLLARALCATGDILLLDEPVAGLDPKVTADMYALIDRLHQEGVTILMISHDLRSAMLYANKILHIGKRLFFGTKEEYQASELGRHFLEQEVADDVR